MSSSSNKNNVVAAPCNDSCAVSRPVTRLSNAPPPFLHVLHSLTVRLLSDNKLTRFHNPDERSCRHDACHMFGDLPSACPESPT